MPRSIDRFPKNRCESIMLPIASEALTSGSPMSFMGDAAISPGGEAALVAEEPHRAEHARVERFFFGVVERVV